MRAKASSNYGSEVEQGSATRTFSVSGHVLNAPKPVPGLYLVRRLAYFEGVHEGSLSAEGKDKVRSRTEIPLN